MAVPSGATMPFSVLSKYRTEDFMAATRLIPLHVNKGKTIAQTISERTDYADNPDKTDNGELVTGYECDPRTVDTQFILTKNRYSEN